MRLTKPVEVFPLPTPGISGASASDDENDAAALVKGVAAADDAGRATCRARRVSVLIREAIVVAP